VLLFIFKLFFTVRVSYSTATPFALASLSTCTITTSSARLSLVSAQGNNYKCVLIKHYFPPSNSTQDNGEGGSFGGSSSGMGGIGLDGVGGESYSGNVPKTVARAAARAAEAAASALATVAEGKVALLPLSAAMDAAEAETTVVTG
jgi:hypothetical protein